MSFTSSGSFEAPRKSHLSTPETILSGSIGYEEIQLPNNEAQPSWRSLFNFTTRKHSTVITIALIATTASGIIKPTAAIFFGKIFSILTKFGAGEATGQETLQQVTPWCIALVALGAAAWAIEGLFLSTWLAFGELQALSVRERMFKGMLEKDMEWYDMRKDGIASLLVRLQTQIRELQLAVSQPLGLLVFEIVGTLAALGLAFYYSWQLTLVIISSFPIATVILYVISTPLNPAIERQKRELSEASKIANTAIHFINTVKACNGQVNEVWQYSDTIKKVASSYCIQTRVNAMQFGIMKFVIIGLFVQGFWFGLHLVDLGMDPGHVLTTFYACLAGMQSIEIVLPQWLVITKGMSAGHTLQYILKEVRAGRTTNSVTGSRRPDFCDGDIEVNGVSFAYPSNPQQPALQRATFFFPQGETTFIVGKSGSGKSTVGNLLLKYYEAHSGEILINGYPIQTLDSEWLRQNISLVQQQSVLFNETVLQNIVFGNHKHSTRQDILDASLTADLDETLEALPHGLDTVVGSNGKSLSGGQTQRVAIARARLRDAPIVILDEATSALDQKSRQKVMAAIRQWRKGKTTIVITHDVTQIRDEAYIYVMERGKVIQEGYRKKLAEKKHGAFALFLANTDLEAATIEKKDNLEDMVPNSDMSAFNPFDEDEERHIESRWSYISRIFGMQDSSPGNRHSKYFGNNPFKRLTLGGTPAELESGDDFALNDEFSPPTPIQSQGVSTSFLSPTPGAFATFATISPRSRQNSSFPARQLSTRTNLSLSRRGSTNAAHLKPKLPPLDTELAALQTRLPPSPKPRSNSRDSGMVQPSYKKPASFTKIFKTIWPVLVWNERFSLVFGFFSAFIVAASTPAFAFVFSNLLSVYYLPSGRGSAALKWALPLLGVAFIDGAAAFCTHFFLEYAGQAWINSLRVEGLRRILSQPRSWFDKEKHAPAKLSEYLDRNAEEMRNLVGRFAGLVFTAVWMLGITLVWCLLINWRLTMVAIACAPVSYAQSRGFGWISSKWEAKVDKAAELTSSIFTETFSNIRVVRALTLERHFSDKYTKATADTYKTGISRAAYSALIFGLGDTLSFWTTATVFYYGTTMLTHGDPDGVASIIKVVNLLLFGIANVTALISLIPQISSSRATATQVLYLAKLPLDHLHESSGTKRIETPFPIVFNNLNFTYPSHTTSRTLRNINLQINPSTITAIVGPSGSGKSTLSSLLLALYPPNAPRSLHHPSPLTFSGIPVSELHTQSLRSQVALIPQTPHLFPTTIYHNITYGLPPLSPYSSVIAVTTAAKEAGIHDFIMSLPSGYGTLIGEGGQGLSGGQGQRIVIARALVRHSKLLVMDEATSALDAVTAEGIRETVKRIVERGRGDGEGTSVVVVSHSREMMRIADVVCVLEQGRIVEKGVFDELTGRGGAFARLIEGGDGGEGEGGGEMSPTKVKKGDVWSGQASGSGLGITMFP